MAIANCNWWQYSRWIYQIGRSVKAKAFTPEEREAVIAFIVGFTVSRPAIVSRLNIKKGDVAEIAKQNDYALGKMVQLIGRQIKVVPPTEEEKALCDAMFEKVADGIRVPGWIVPGFEEGIAEEEQTDDNPGEESGENTESTEGEDEAGNEGEDETSDPEENSESNVEE